MANFALFGYNGRGFSFEIEQTCGKLNTPVQCSVTFNNSTVVEAMGLIHRAKFVPDPDIAGIGVSFSILHLLFIVVPFC